MSTGFQLWNEKYNGRNNNIAITFWFHIKIETPPSQIIPVVWVSGFWVHEIAFVWKQACTSEVRFCVCVCVFLLVCLHVCIMCERVCVSAWTWYYVSLKMRASFCGYVLFDIFVLEPSPALWRSVCISHNMVPGLVCQSLGPSHLCGLRFCVCLCMPTVRDHSNLVQFQIASEIQWVPTSIETQQAKQIWLHWSLLFREKTAQPCPFSGSPTMCTSSGTPLVLGWGFRFDNFLWSAHTKDSSSFLFAGIAVNLYTRKQEILSEIQIKVHS